MTLLSKSRFGHAGQRSAEALLGPVWRVTYPSHFGRDALCCDIFVASDKRGASSAAPRRVRLINVHLDSLPIEPSHRPRQISIAASFLRSAGRGLFAGDFNPVLPEDETLIAENGLTDAWVEVRGPEDGFTWGIDGDQPFPPGRLDKIATIGLKTGSIEVIHPGSVPVTRRKGKLAGGAGGNGPDEGAEPETVPWSDHSGLFCSFHPVQAV